MEPENVPEPPHPRIRISDAERDAVISQLNTATAEGRLTIGEFEQRAKQVYAAQYATDLVPLTADLPASTGGAVTPAVIPVQNRKRRRWFIQIMGDTARGGNWHPDGPVNSFTLMGGQTIDLTEVEATEVTINAFTMMAGTEIIVPKGAQVDLRGFILMGGSSNEAIESGESQMRVTVRSYGLMGGCEVRHLKPKEEAKRLRRG